MHLGASLLCALDGIGPCQAQSKKGVQNRKVLVDLSPAARRFVGELQPELRWRVLESSAIGVSRNLNENLDFPNFQGRFALDERFVTQFMGIMLSLQLNIIPIVLTNRVR